MLWLAVGTSLYSCLFYFFPYSRLSSYLLRLFLYLISFLLFPCASVWGNTCAWVPHFLYSQTRWDLLFFARRNGPCFGRSFAYQNLIKQNYVVSWSSQPLSYLEHHDCLMLSQPSSYPDASLVKSTFACKCQHSLPVLCFLSPSGPTIHPERHPTA